MRDVIQDDWKARELVEAACRIKVAQPFRGLVFVDGAELIGAAVLNHFAGRDVHFSCTLLNADVGMRIARRVAWYVFKVMDCHRCTAVTPRSNLRAITALETLGFRFEGILREHYEDNEDGMIYGLLRSEQRLLRNLGD